MDRLATPALPARSSSPTRHAGAKSGSTAYKTASTSGCPQRAAGPTTLRLKYDPATPRDGAKGFRTRLTPLQLRESGRRGWPDGPQRVTAEEEDGGLQPVDEGCKAKVATQKSGHLERKPMDNDNTHLEHRSTAKTRHQWASHPTATRGGLPR